MCAYTKYPGMHKYTRMMNILKVDMSKKNYISFKVLLLADNAVDTAEVCLLLRNKHYMAVEYFHNELLI